MTNWAILGCGSIANKFAEDLNRTDGANLYAVASREQVRADAFGSAYQADIAYGSYEAMLIDPKVDIVYIATPHVFHKEQTLLCLKHKKAVLCEKTFAMNQSEVKEMIAAAKAQNVFLMEALWTYFLPHYKFVLEKVHSGEYGNIQSLKADFGIDVVYNPQSRLYNKAVGGGSLLDVGIYPVFAGLSLLGITDDIIARAVLGPTNVDHRCDIILNYPNNVKAELFCAVDKNTETICQIDLEKAEILINSRFHGPSNVTVTQNGIPITYDFPIPDGIHGYHYEILHCQEMLAKGKTESDVMTFEKSRQLIKMLDSIRAKIGLSY